MISRWMYLVDQLDSKPRTSSCLREYITLMTINVQLLDQKCISYLMSINYFTHLNHSTALQQIITMI